MKSLNDHHVALKAFTAFLIVALAAVLFFVYREYSDKVYYDGNLETFTILAIMAGVLLIGLLYLVNKPHPATKSTKKKKR